MKKELIAYKNPKSPVAETFRTLRTNIQFMNSKKNLKSVLITSTMPGEGKSWTAANLAVTFAQSGKKVVIVDCDLRKGRQFSVFNVTARPGVSNYLSGVVNEGEVYDVDDIRSFVRETDIEDLYVIPAGDVPPNPSELLVNSRMMQLLDDLREQFDIIIFDAPPALLVTDAMILARIVDTTMIVVAHQETKMDNLNKVQKSIKNVGGNIAGVVINKIPISVKKYQDSYYGEYYGEAQDVMKARNTTNQDLYLRGKATILDDRNKKKEMPKNEEFSKNVENVNIKVDKNSNEAIDSGLEVKGKTKAKKTTTTTKITESVTTTTTVPEITYAKGDLNHDGKISIADLVCCANQVLGVSRSKFSCDVNDDNIADVFDVIIMRKIVINSMK